MTIKLFLISIIIVIFIFIKYHFNDFNNEEINIFKKADILLEHLNIVNNIPYNKINLLFKKIQSIYELKNNESNEWTGVDQFRYCIDIQYSDSIYIWYPGSITNFKNNIDKVSYKKLIQIKNSDNIFNDKNSFNSINSKDINLSNSKFKSKINQLILEVSKYYKVNNLRIVGFFFYPKNGYIGWHTDKNNKGRRSYLTWAEEDKKSFFRYYDNKKQKMVTKYDKKGWKINSFEVKPGELFWHCVYSDTNRISIGFQY
jgi:hypothetical protein